MMMREFPSLIASGCNDSEDREEVSGWTNFGCFYLYWLDSWEFESYFMEYWERWGIMLT